MNCPRCNKEYEDFDGVGVVYCAPPDGCGFCHHLSRDGKEIDGRTVMVCGFCGDIEDEQPREGNPAAAIPALFDLAALSLHFGRTNRVTYHEDGTTPESDTDHTVMLGLTACAFAAQFVPRLDLGLVAQFSIVHDLAEALCGDTNTLRIDQAGRDEKERREHAAREEIRRRFSAALPWVPDTLDRYERLADPEARFIKVLDKVLPKITHALNGGAALREHGVDLAGLAAVNGSQRETIARTYGADQQEAVALLFSVHEELVRRLTEQPREGGAEKGREPNCLVCDDKRTIQTVKMCTSCPHPCKHCKDASGIYCASAPCSCDCHKSGAEIPAAPCSREGEPPPAVSLPLCPACGREIFPGQMLICGMRLSANGR